ncbi:hypothetical protein INT45_001871 [Circinella minor]|uniref:Uncharacterized protein n=1 Tax=Circinella minor TaxID=1195481 RepID=A0A8H7VM56_9FUNG|nr:hypothetical protein INT45_001871 [Circinella minor]
MPKILFDEEGEAVGSTASVDIAKEEKLIQKIVNDSESDSDDEAPEAISATSAKDFILQAQKTQKELLARAAAEEKDKRRQREQRLREQKQGSRREQKRKQQDVGEKGEEEEDNKMAELTEEDNAELLPEELLVQAAEEEKTKKNHLKAEDLERLLVEVDNDTEQSEKDQRKKRKTQTGVRQVGEYTVKVLSKRPRAPAVDQELKSFKDKHSLYKKDLPRKSALLQRSEGIVGKAASQFRRR